MRNLSDAQLAKLLDKDIFTVNPDEIKDILPVMTMVGGKIVFKR